MKKNLFSNPFFYSIFFTLFSLIIHRYSYGIGDQAVHIPLIEKVIDSNLYPNDLLFTAGQGELSFFYIFIEYIVKMLNFSIERVFFIGYLIFTFLLYFALYLIGKHYFSKEVWGIVLLSLFFIAPLHVAGTATYTIEISFVPRFVALILSLYAMYFVLIKKYFFVFMILPFVFAIHPISFIPIFFILLLIVVNSRHYPSRFNLVLFILIFLLINFTLVSNIYHRFGNNSVINGSQEWIMILRERNFYVFLDQWDYKAWISLFLITLPSIYFIFTGNRKNRLIKLIKIIFVTCVVFTFFQFLFTSVFTLPFIAQLQLARIWVFTYLSSSLAVVHFLTKQKINLKILSILAIFILLSFSFIHHKKWYYTQNSNWITIQKWVSENTDKDCLFLTPFRHQGFRIYAKRSIVAEYKDGTLSFYSQNFANEWKNRLKDTEYWEELDINNLIKLQNKYFFSYLVALNGKNIPLKPIYNDIVYSIYQMPVVQKECMLKNI